MPQSKKDNLLDNLGVACDNFSSILKTIRLFDGYMDSSDHTIPPGEVENVRNKVKAPLAIMLAYMQGTIEELLEEFSEQAS